MTISLPLLAFRPWPEPCPRSERRLEAFPLARPRQSPARGPQGAPRDRVSAGFGRLDEKRDVLIFFDIVGANEDRGLVLLVLFSADLDRGVADILVVISLTGTLFTTVGFAASPNDSHCR